MNDSEIIELALRAAELAYDNGRGDIGRVMLSIAVIKLQRHVSLPDPSLVVTTDFERGCPCS